MPCLQPFRGDSSQLLLYKIALCLSEGGFVAGVSSFNGQTGPVTFTGGDVITLLGFTPISQADGDALYVLKTGDTMTGPLSIDNGALVAGASGVVLTTSLTLPYVAIAATYTASAADHTIDATSGTFDVDLPTAVGITGRIYVIKNSGVGTITIDPAGAELIDSLATATLVSGASITTQSTGTGWIII